MPSFFTSILQKSRDAHRLIEASDDLCMERHSPLPGSSFSSSSSVKQMGKRVERLILRKGREGVDKGIDTHKKELLACHSPHTHQ